MRFKSFTFKESLPFMLFASFKYKCEKNTPNLMLRINKSCDYIGAKKKFHEKLFFDNSSAIFRFNTFQEAAHRLLIA